MTSGSESKNFSIGELMARHKLTREQRIKGCRKALANPRTPKGFRPGLKKQLAKLLACASLLVFNFFDPTASYAQFSGFTTPQTVQQTLAPAGTACGGSPQSFVVQNLGQTQHFASVIPSAAVTNLSMVIQGQDNTGNVFAISDTVFTPGIATVTGNVTGTGYFPIVKVVIICTGGTFTLNYSGTSSTPNVLTGSYLGAAIDKNLFVNSLQSTNVASSLFTPPFGTTFGKLIFVFNTSSVALASISLSCVFGSAPTVTLLFSIANNTNEQIFQVPGMVCQEMQVGYNGVGAAPNTFSLDYLFDPPGTSSLGTSGANLGSTMNEGVLLTEKGARWSTTSSPVVSLKATASQAAGASGIRHVADCISYSLGAIAAPAATRLTINLIDGASGGVTVLWTKTVAIPATAAPHYDGNFCGLNLIGTAATAMTLELSALLTNEFESVTLTGYDVQ
jgi:hypothetical protein